MKELENHNKIEIQAEQQQKIDKVFMGRKQFYKGMILWEYNVREKVLTEAKFKQTSAEMKTGDVTFLQIKHTVIVNSGCIYFQASNKKNAIRKAGNYEKLFIL